MCGLCALALHAGSPEAALGRVADWASSLSLGEQQRLAWARLLLARPRLALLDEATSALDQDTEAKLYKVRCALRGAPQHAAHTVPCAAIYSLTVILRLDLTNKQCLYQ